MKKKVRDIASSSDERIQEMKLDTFSPVFAFLLVILFIGAAAGIWIFSEIKWLEIVPLALLLVFLIIMISSGKSKRHRAEAFLEKAKQVIIESDSDEFSRILDEQIAAHRNDQSYMNYILLKLYSHMIPLIAEDFMISDNEKKIIQRIKTEINTFDPDRNLIQAIQLYYLENFMSEFQLTRFAMAPEGKQPYPESKEEFILKFIDVFNVSERDIKPYLHEVGDLIVRHCMEFIEQENTQALFHFFDEREKKWGVYSEMMKETIFAIYSSMIPIIARDHIIDSEEKKIIEYLNKKVSKYLPYNKKVEKISRDFLKDYVGDIMHSEKASDRELEFINNFVNTFGLSHEETKHYFENISKHISIREIEKGSLEKVSPSISTIREADDCYFESKVTILDKEFQPVYAPQRGMKDIYKFIAKREGEVFITRNTIQLSMRSLHVIGLDDVETAHLLSSHDVVELTLRGEMGNFYLKTPDNKKAIAIINQLRNV